jgi:hypothetical protein
MRAGRGFLLTGIVSLEYCTGKDLKEIPMLVTPLASALIRDSVSRAMNGSRGADPVVPYIEARPTRARARRTRTVVAATLHRLAETVAVPEQRPVC